jgi:hypothetical protein
MLCFRFLVDLAFGDLGRVSPGGKVVASAGFAESGWSAILEGCLFDLFGES